MGSRLTTPTLPDAAVVVSDPRADAKKTPCSQFRLSHTRGMVPALLPPKIIPDMGTPFGLLNSSDKVGQFLMETVNLELGWAI